MINEKLLDDAINSGQLILKSGGTKADAARAIFDLIKDEPKEIVVNTFVKGANLTPKGALTYWYNCSRK